MKNWFLKIYLRELRDSIAKISGEKDQKEIRELMVELIDTITEDRKHRIEELNKYGDLKNEDIKITKAILSLPDLIQKFCNLKLPDNDPRNQGLPKNDPRDLKLPDDGPLLSSAWILLGICYREGYVVPYNTRKKALECRREALVCFREALRLGNVNAYSMLAESYSRVNEPWTQLHELGALEYNEAGLKAGVSSCIFTTAPYYMWGEWKYPKHIQSYFQLLCASADSGYLPAKINLAIHTMQDADLIEEFRHYFDGKSPHDFVSSYTIENNENYSPVACHLLASYYATLATPEDPQAQERHQLLATRYYKSAAESGYTASIRCLAEEYLQKNKIPEALAIFEYGGPFSEIIKEIVNSSSPIERAERIADNLLAYDCDIAHHLGALYENGYYFEKDFNRALAYYSLGAVRGDIESELGQIRCLLFGEDIINNSELGCGLLSFLFQAKERASYKFAATFGRCLELGLGRERDLKQAVELYQAATKANHDGPDGWYYYGRLFEKQKNVGQAKECYQKIESEENAFDSHFHSMAMCRLGEITLAEAGIEDTLTVEMATIHQASAEAPKLEVKKQAEELNREVPFAEKLKKAQEAFEYFQKGEKSRSNYQARYQLCRMYEEGLGVARDRNKSRPLFESLQQSATLNRLEAIFYTAKCYENGFGVPFDLKGAFSQYKLFFAKREADKEKGYNNLKQR